MERTHIKDVLSKIGQEVTVCGFVQAIRNQGSIKFIMVRDVSGLMQAVVLKNSDAFSIIDELTLESVIKISGLAKTEKQAAGGFEVEVKSLEILSKSEPILPIPVVIEKSGGETEQATRLDYRWIDLRRQDKLLIFKVWTELEKGFRKFWNGNGYIQFYAPALMNAASEGGSEFFTVDYFDRKAYLAQSPQFYKQMAMAAGFEKVFAVGPVFRAEPSFTTRHLTEFTGWDAEISFIESHHDVMDQEEGMIVEGFKQVKESLNLDIKIPERPFPRIPMSEAKAKLKAAGVTGEKEHDLSPEEEKALSKIILEETGSEFVFITDYHKSIRAFYHMRHKDNPDLTMSFDLLFKGIEITTGAQREHRPEILVKQAIEKGVDPETIKEYVSFFKYGCPPHGGLGIGPARIIMNMLDLPNVREATYLPRDVKRLVP
jgi:nondiscriminating aspartyl-tRNA synthetase